MGGSELGSVGWSPARPPARPPASPPARLPTRSPHSNPAPSSQDCEQWFLDRIMRGRPVPLPAPGVPLVTLTHVDDVASLLATVPGNAAAVGQHFNSCSDRAVSHVGVVRALAAAAGKDAEARGGGWWGEEWAWAAGGGRKRPREEAGVAVACGGGRGEREGDTVTECSHERERLQPRTAATHP